MFQPGPFQCSNVVLFNVPTPPVQCSNTTVSMFQHDRFNVPTPPFSLFLVRNRLISVRSRVFQCSNRVRFNVPTRSVSMFQRGPFQCSNSTVSMLQRHPPNVPTYPPQPGSQSVLIVSLYRWYFCSKGSGWRLLATGCWLVTAGCWLLAGGTWLVAARC